MAHASCQCGFRVFAADVVDEGDFKPETEAIENGAFAESSKRSAPYFDIKYIDGVSEL